MNLDHVKVLPVSPISPEFLDRATTLTGAFIALTERFPTWRCLTILDRDREERTLSLGRLWERARMIHAALVARGLRPGDVVLLALPTGEEIVAAYFGVLLGGGIPGLVATPSNRLADWNAYAERVGAIARNAAPRLFYCDDQIAAPFRNSGTAGLGGAVLLTPSEVRTDAASSLTVADPDGIATVQYSSGSTGTPKGILLTHRAMLNNIRAVRDGIGITPADPSVNWIPLYHDMGLIDAFLLPLLSGCPTILIPTMDFMRDPALWLWAIHHYRGALSWAPNFAYTLCAKRLADVALAGLDLSSWRIAINAAEPVLASTIDAFTERFAVYGFAPEAMIPAWGLAENVTIATAHRTGDRPRVEFVDRHALSAEGVVRPAAGAEGLAAVAIGRCLPDCAVEIRDADRRPVPERHVGTVWLRTNSLFVGYHHEPDRTAETLVDGWLDTGDQGWLADGELYFATREKDLIVIGGEKYVPHDIETVINRVPGVREGCAVAFGVLNEERGTEELAAVVETRERDPEALDRLRDGLRAEVMRVTGLALRWVVLAPPGGIEKTSSGKLARRATQHRHATAFAR
jgi:acyl-CoA synthetase (AMP-forming)/AMP-acid ligase II